MTDLAMLKRQCRGNAFHVLSISDAGERKMKSCFVGVIQNVTSVSELEFEGVYPSKN